MVKCIICGKQYNYWTSGEHPGRCEECGEKFVKELKIKQQTEKDVAKSRLMSIVEHHIVDEKLQVFGIAYWDTAGTATSSVVNKVMGAALLGGFGWQVTGATHRVGVIAVTETKLYVIECGNVVGEEVKAGSVMATTDGKRVKSFQLEDLTVQDIQATTKGILTIAGTVQMKATFPSSYEMGNADKAVQIARAIINSATKVVSVSKTVPPYLPNLPKKRYNKKL